MAEKDSAAKEGLKRDTVEVNQQLLTKLDSFVINTDKPKFPKYAENAKRVDSFKNWPKNLPIKPDIMIDAGLVYTGSGDNVRCYHCGGALRNWEKDDDPWEEHAKWYPKCPHVVLVKGQNYIDCVARGEKPPETEGAMFLKKDEQRENTESQLLHTVAAQNCNEKGFFRRKIKNT